MNSSSSWAGRVGLEVLGVEQLRQPQVAAVGQPGALFAELDLVAAPLACHTSGRSHLRG